MISKIGCILILAGLAACQTGQDNDQSSLDLLIRNATIIDGSGSPSFRGHVGIKDGIIQFVQAAMPENMPAGETIDADGAVLSPGFIDLHSHGNPEKTPEFENFLAMGVTTICLGQDGSGITFRSNDEWQRWANQSVGVNIISFAGHGTLRELSGIGMKEDPSALEMDSLSSLLEMQLDWCYGLSTGLEYSPGLYAGRDELLSIARVVGKRDRIIMSHMRNEDDGELFTSIDELAMQGTECRVHIAHLKSVYGKGEVRADEILQHIRSYRNQGIELTADIYPYTASYTGISIVFPEWAKTEAQFQSARTERRKELEAYLRNRVMSRNGPSATLFGTEPYAGKSLADLQEEWGMPFEDILIDSIGPQGASAAYFVMDEELQEALIADTLIAICSDGSPMGYHPRGHGTHARIIEEFVMKRNVLKLNEAIRKMTSYPARILGLEDRGLIKTGMVADLVIFDPEEIQENATFEDPFQLSEGFEIVIVNGNVARRDGKLESELHGQFLTPEE